MASTGEVAAFGVDVHEAYWAYVLSPGPSIHPFISCDGNQPLPLHSSLLSTNGFKVPQSHSGVLLGGDINTPQLATVARGLSDLGFKLYCSSPVVEEFLNELPYMRKVERIFFPLKDKRKLREVFDEVHFFRLHPFPAFPDLNEWFGCVQYDIQCVINLAKFRGRDQVDEDYVARRCASSPLSVFLFLPKTEVFFPLSRNAVDFGLPLIVNPALAQLFVEAFGKKLLKGDLKGYHEGRIPKEVKPWSDWIGSHN